MFRALPLLALSGESPFGLSIDPGDDDAPEPAGGTTDDNADDVEAPDPDDEEVDIDSDDEDEDAESEELLNALGGPKKPRRKHLRDPEHGAIHRTLIRNLKQTRRTAKQASAEIAARRQKLEEDTRAFETHRVTVMRDLQGRFVKATDTKVADTKASGQGAKPGQPVAAGKGAQQQPAAEAKAAAAFKMPESQEELDALIQARMGAMFGSLADEEKKQADAQTAEQAKKSDQDTVTGHNAYMNARYAKAPTKEHAALITKANKEVFPTVFQEFRPEFVANRDWYSEFCVLLAEHPHMQEVYNTFARIPRSAGLYKRKPADVVRDLEETARRFGVIAAPPANLPRPVVALRVKAGRSLNAEATREELLQLEKENPAAFLAELEKNPELIELFPERWDPTK